MNRNSICFGMLAVAMLAATACYTLAGDLNPPAGPIGPTMKPLDQIEPRIPISAATTPGDANHLFRITQPGSYYLTGNITGVAGKAGIEIASGNVTLDLMGFHLIGAPQSFDGVRITTTGIRDVVVRNGTVRGWGADGIDLSNCVGVIVADVIAEENGTRGIVAANQARVSGCIARNNGNVGIFVNEGGIVIDCEAADNGSDGISVQQFVTVERCFAFRNTGDGIRAANRCVIRHNLCQGNGNNGSGAGIHVTVNLCRIERNHVTGNDRGIDVDSGSNLIVGNSAGGNTTNYDIVAGNASGPIVTGANIATNTNPHANYAP